MPAACASAKGVVTAISYQGAVTRISVAADDGTGLTALLAAGASVRKGDGVSLIWPKSAMMPMGGEA